MATGMRSRGRRGWLTTPALEGLKAGEWVADGAPRGEGRLLARRLNTGRVMFYFRYITAQGRRDTLPIGMLDVRGRDGLTLPEARAKVGELRQIRQLDGDIRLTWETREREREHERAAKQAAERSAREAESARRSRTLGALLSAYSEQLERDGKASARSVRAELFNHVHNAWPELWGSPVADVTTDDLLKIVALPVERGHKRQAEKVRAYLRAAYAAGMKARHNPAALQSLRELRITANPARDLTPIEGANRGRDRALSLAELRAYWRRIRKKPAFAVLRFHLLTGCQRVQQLARTKLTDFDQETQTIRLLDHKGRRPEPRKHYVPILPAARDAIREMQGGVLGPFLFTVTGGVSGMDYSGLSKRMRAVAAAMLVAGELPGGIFTPGDLRRTVETQLAGANASKETRARLQSHGLSGVQDRHYNMHEYIHETRAALGTLQSLLTGSKAKGPSAL